MEYQTMRCVNCNQELETTSKFCPFCGQPVEAAPAAPFSFTPQIEDADYTVRLSPEAAADDYTVRLSPETAADDYTVRLDPSEQTYGNAQP